MNLVVFENEAYTQLQKASFDYMRSLIEQERKAPTFGWVNNEEASKLLAVSSRTLQNWRDSGLLGFTPLGGKIYYNLADIDKVLRERYKKPFAQA